ncbi:MAG: glycosyltransferase family 4 protein [Burkholderiales bacterium]|nr:glycosyltransferase family 4 protein [Burkholderiales bacterium]
MWLAISTVLTAFFVAVLSVGWLAHSRAARLALDQPNARSLHTSPVPRTGGIGLLLGVAAGWTWIAPHLPWLFWAALLLLIGVSLLDDLRGLSAAVRLATHLFAAMLMASALPALHESLLLFAVAVLAIGWMCNLYNFMDGSDGLAGGMAVSGFLVYAVAAWLSGSVQFALLNLAVAAAATGFLVHNFHPARIFLGDAGAVPLGFLAASFGIVGWLQHDWTWWFPLLVFSPFIVDASVTLARRQLSGARVWEAHRDHYYQRLVQLGLGHRGTAFAEYALMATSGIAALWAVSLGEHLRLAVIATTCVLYAGLILVIERRWREWQRLHA